MQAALIDPAAESTFMRSKLDHSERERSPHKEMFQLHKDLLRLRREEPVFARVQKRGDFDAAVLSNDGFVMRFFGTPPGGAADRLLVINFGNDVPLQIAPEPLLAPPENYRWAIQLTTEHPCYGGSGTSAPVTDKEGWLLPGRCALLLRLLPMNEYQIETRFRVEGSAQAAKRREPGLPLSPSPPGRGPG